MEPGRVQSSPKVVFWTWGAGAAVDKAREGFKAGKFVGPHGAYFDTVATSSLSNGWKRVAFQSGLRSEAEYVLCVPAQTISAAS